MKILATVGLCFPLSTTDSSWAVAAPLRWDIPLLFCHSPHRALWLPITNTVHCQFSSHSDLAAHLKGNTHSSVPIYLGKEGKIKAVLKKNVCFKKHWWLTTGAPSTAMTTQCGVVTLRPVQGQADAGCTVTRVFRSTANEVHGQAGRLRTVPELSVHAWYGILCCPFFFFFMAIYSDMERQALLVTSESCGTQCLT